MKISVLTAAAVSAAALAAVAFASGVPTEGARTWSAKLTAKQEVPKPAGAAAASGTFHANGGFKCAVGEMGCDVKPGKMRWTLTFTRLTGPAVAAHLHIGKVGVAGPVVIALCGPCRNGQKGTITVSKKVFQAAGTRRLYVNVHTAKNEAGEIRGQIDMAAVL